MNELVKSLPTERLRELREEAMWHCPEWQDVGKAAKRELNEREARDNE